MPGGLAGDTANMGVCGCTASRSRIVEVEPRPGAGGALTWCDAGEWCATSTVGLCGVLFYQSENSVVGAGRLSILRLYLSE